MLNFTNDQPCWLPPYKTNLGTQTCLSYIKNKLKNNCLDKIFKVPHYVSLYSYVENFTTIYTVILYETVVKRFGGGGCYI